MTSEKRSSSVIFASVSRTRSSSEAAWPWAAPDSAIVSAIVNSEGNNQHPIACIVRPPLHDRIVPRRLAAPHGAQLGHVFLRLEVDVHDSELVAEPGGPLTVVHQAPQEGTLDRHACPPRNADTDMRHSPFLWD